jgi:hypothetical protein
MIENRYPLFPEKNIPNQKIPARHKDANSILVEIGFLSRRKKLKTKLSEDQTMMV